jgi:hypothetical protein
MRIEHNGIIIDLEFDGEGFPILDIVTDGYYGDNDRPTIEINLNGVEIHDMFDSEEDLRWK